MPANTTTAANAIREHYISEFYDGVFRNDSFLGLFGKRSSAGDTSHRWKMFSAANSSVETFIEG